MQEIFSSVLSNTFTLNGYLYCIFAAFACGIIIALSVSFRNKVTKSFIISLIVLPMIVQTVITMVNGNIGTGVAVMGAFSLVRFRSVPGKAKDIAAIFLAMTAGLACATGYIAIAILFSLIMGVVMIVLSNIPMGDDRFLDLRITVPESLNFVNEFDDIFEKYTHKHHLYKTKTTNMGSLYKLYYKIQIKDAKKVREFVDELRCRNGNLEIAVCDAPEGNEEL